MRAFIYAPASGHGGRGSKVPGAACSPFQSALTNHLLKWRTIMTTINLKRYYPYMTENVMLEVSDEIAAALSMGGRLCDSYKRQKRRNGECSLDAQEQNIALANFRRKKLSQTGIRGSNGNIGN